jgi:hypothetical protein
MNNLSALWTKTVNTLLVRNSWRPREFSDGLAWVSVGGKIGFIDKLGKFVINPQFEWEGASDFIGGVSVLSARAINKEGKAIWKASKPASCEEGE